MRRLGWLGLLLALVPGSAMAQSRPVVVARVAALDQPFMWNRLGASQPNGMIFALEGDLVPLDTPIDANGNDVIAAGAPRALRAGEVRLRSRRRPRPLVLRVNEGEILEIHFSNLLAPEPKLSSQGETRHISPHVMGLEIVDGPIATWAGANAPGLTKPGERRVYRYIARDEGTFILHPGSGWQGDLERSQGGLVGAGLFGTVVVEPAGAEYYRSQVTQAELAAATTGRTPAGQPILNYKPLRMTREIGPGRRELISGDLTAIITGPNAGRFPADHPSLAFAPNPVYPDRHRPFREVAVMYHQFLAVQAFPQFYDPQLFWMLLSAQDNFAINYGMAGIGAEVLANRMGVGPAGRSDAVDLKFEEFFLSSWANGDPAMVVDVPANTTPKRSATKAFYPDDPSNVYHSYLGDRLKFRVSHPGQGISHVHHQHAHQWLHSPKSDSSTYLDSQLLTPGAAYSLEIAYDTGNVNRTVGDALFHCHFYVHFATGMWAILRVHDVLETGTLLDAAGRPVIGNDSQGQPIWNRALPDGEITTGTPIPAVVPMPTIAMAPMPAAVRLVDEGRRVEVKPAVSPSGEEIFDNPGFPFFVPGVAGHRAPHPPMDFGWEQLPDGSPKLDAAGNRIPLDGGLPRHLVLDGTVARESHTRWDFTKEVVRYDAAGKLVAGGMTAFELPDAGTAIERAAMRAYAAGSRPSYKPDGTPAPFAYRGAPPVEGAPFADPRMPDDSAPGDVRRYQGAVVQTDVVFNKKGWHQPQQRVMSLWEDVAANVAGTRAPEPLFLRSNSGDTIEFWHTNLVPNYYELDDFLVRTPTDILGQHIHLVKYDLLGSDGAANGFNYEDGTFSPDEVRSRIDAINARGGLFAFDPSTRFIDRAAARQRRLTAKPAPAVFGQAPASQNWLGAQTTIQRWDSDPVRDSRGTDRTMRTVFTHDHFGASTHQVNGLYGALLTEPKGSYWLDAITGARMHTRADGGPTSWQAVIVTPDPKESYREFALMVQESTLAYAPAKPGAPRAAPSALFDASAREAEPLGRGEISAALRERFSDAGTVLSPKATVSRSGSNWIIRDTEGGQAGTEFTLKLETLFTIDDADGSGAAALDALKIDDELVFDLSGTAAIKLAATPVVTVVRPGQAWRVDDLDIRKDASGALAFDGIKVYAAANGEPSLDYANAINPFFDVANSMNGAPYPMMVNTFPVPGTYSVNYRNEPLPFRVSNPASPSVARDRADESRDLAHAFRSIPRHDGALNQQPRFSFTGAGPNDPFTPLLRAYENDRIQVRAIAGANHHPHYFGIEGVKWLFEPSFSNSGYRNTQGFGTSEHFEFNFTLDPSSRDGRAFTDRVYRASMGTGGVTNGAWGLLRAYDGKGGAGLLPDLTALPSNPEGRARWSWSDRNLIPAGARVRRYHVIATTAAQALPRGRLTYNSRGQVVAADGRRVDPRLAIDNPYALLYVRAEHLDARGRFRAGIAIEPLVLRAAAGDWLEVTVSNRIDPKAATIGASAFLPFSSAPPGTPFSTAEDQINYALSYTVGLRPQLVAHDPAMSGLNAGGNPVSTVVPHAVDPKRSSITYRWYAGSLAWDDAKGRVIGTPIEFGTTNLSAADPVLQHRYGMIGALVIEPAGATWRERPGSQTVADVTPRTGRRFREFVMMMTDDATLYSRSPLVTLDRSLEPALARREFTYELQVAVANAGLTLSPGTSISIEDPGRLWLLTDNNTVVAIKPGEKGLDVYSTYQQTVNYGSEPLQLRHPLQPTGFDNDRTDLSPSLANVKVGGDPQTPILVAEAGSAVRFRIAHAEGVRPVRPNGIAFFIAGHSWQELPFTDDSTRLGHNPHSERLGSRERHGPHDHFDILIDSAGGSRRKTGDFLYGAYPSDEINGGTWGVFRVVPRRPAVIGSKR